MCARLKFPLTSVSPLQLQLRSKFLARPGLLVRLKHILARMRSIGQHCCIELQESAHAIARAAASRMRLQVRRKLQVGERDPDAIDEAASEDGGESVSSDFLMKSQAEVERAMHLAQQGEVSFEDGGGLHFALQQPVPVDCVYVTAKDIENISDHYIIFIWNRNFDQVIEFLRLRLLTVTRSVLLVTDEPLSATQWCVSVHLCVCVSVCVSV